MDVWIQLEMAAREILKLNQREALDFGFRAQHFQAYFQDTAAAEQFLKAFFALRKRNNKFRPKRCRVCKANCQDKETGIIHLNLGRCDKCFKKEWGLLEDSQRR